MRLPKPAIKENTVTIMVDIYEPKEIEDIIKQVVPTIRMSLNHSSEGFADYLWFACDGHRIQVERKQASEILSGLDDVEEQLGREVNNGVEETILLIEGVCGPVPGFSRATQTYMKPKKSTRDMLIAGHKFNVNYVGYQAWKSQLDKAGITIVETFDWEATALTLVALYNNSQKEEHTTLRRYIKEHITVQPFNEHVITLMGIRGANLGEGRAKALIERYGTVWYTLNQPAEALAETLVGEEGKEKRLGMATVNKLFKAIGKTA